jgi:MoxR-like ATPase
MGDKDTQAVLVDLGETAQCAQPVQRCPIRARDFQPLVTGNPSLGQDQTIAQLDRFLFKLRVSFPSLDELHTIMDRTTQSEQPTVKEVITQARLLEMKHFVREVPVARHVQDYALRLLQATHPEFPTAPEITKRYVRFGSSPRGAQAIMVTAKVRAMIDGRFNVSCEDIRQSAMSAFRHRVILNFEGEAEGVDTDDILAQIIAKTPENTKN